MHMSKDDGATLGHKLLSCSDERTYFFLGMDDVGTPTAHGFSSSLNHSGNASYDGNEHYFAQPAAGSAANDVRVRRLRALRIRSGETRMEGTP
jgi:hypothetical protein